ncbi:MAG: TPM domain-containing protein [Desulfobulbaceae bacterium]|nr:TPM domain-containing protein [Desulfobulbaceae bacterium]
MKGIASTVTLVGSGQGKKRFCALCLTLWCVFVFAAAVSALEPPAFRGYVNDYAKLFSAETVQQLEQALRTFEETDSTQIAVLTIDSLEGDALEEFSIRTVEQWGVGQRGKDNGVLLLVVKNDRKLRIEVGRGLEGVLTDLMAGRIVDLVIRPAFKEGRFDDGVKAGVTAIMQACRGEFTAGPRTQRSGGRQEPPSALSYLFFGLFITSFLGRASRPLGVAAGAILLPLAAFLGVPSIGLFFLLLLMPLGALGGFILPFIVSDMLMSRGGMSIGGGGFGGGGFGGFGGGSFGGGGASGSW